MNHDDWKEQVQSNVAAMGRFLRSLAPGTLYGFMATSTLMPLTIAATPEEMHQILTAIIDSEGADVIAHELRNWPDRNEAELAQELQERVAADDVLRDTIDALMHEARTALALQNALADADQEWFVDTLRDEMAQLGNVSHHAAIVTGSGAIATDGSVAAGAGGVAVGGDVHGGINVHNYPDPPDPAEIQANEAEERYLRALLRQCNILPFGSLGGSEGVDEEIALEDVYIALNVEDQNKERLGQPDAARVEKREPVPALEVMAGSQRLVLLGAAGAGKSTFAKQVLVRVAKARLGQGEPLVGWPADLIPLLLHVRDLGPYLETLALDGLTADKRERALIHGLQRCLHDQMTGEGCAPFCDRLDSRLSQGKVFLVLDGLDEVGLETRPLVREAVIALRKRSATGLRLLVTARTYSYTEAITFPSFSRADLAPFNEEQIEDFIAAWYGAQRGLGRLTKKMADARRTDLQNAVGRKELVELAANPMLLTTMAIVHTSDVGLPRERVKLYKRAIQILLHRWNQDKNADISDELKAVLANESKMRLVMERLAYEAHSRRKDQAADLPRGELLTLLDAKEYLGDTGLVAEFLQYVDQRAGLLIGRGGGAERPHQYAFPHRSIQEYLAGCQLLRGRDMLRGRDVDRTYLNLVPQGDYWALAALMGAEELYYNRDDLGALLNLMYALCPVSEPKSDDDWRAVLWAGQMAVMPERTEIAGDTIRDGGEAFLTRLRTRLLGVMRESGLTPIERAHAGRALGVLGDPRVEVLDPLQIEWCDVPAGPFTMGGDAFQALEQHEANIPYAYRISRYPVTNAQFAQFVADGGYARAEYWIEAAQEGLWRDGLYMNRSGPVEQPDPYHLPNHPRNWVSWYEALAFARYLTDVRHEGGQLAPNWKIRLPSELEWEKAARGPDGRTYPWGNEITPHYANYAESGVGTTNAVGCFAQGRNRCGLEDVGGNVWEWTRTLWGTSFSKSDFNAPYDASDGREELAAGRRTRRVLRGGAFGNSVRLVRCAARLRFNPYFADVGYGFRLVAAPILPLASKASGR